MTNDTSLSSPDSADGLVTPANARPLVMDKDSKDGSKLAAGVEEGLSKRNHVNGVATPRSRSPVGNVARSPGSPRTTGQDTTPKARDVKLPAYIASESTVSGSRERVVSPARPNVDQQRAYLPRNVADEADSPRTRSPFSTTSLPVNLPTNHAQGISWPLSKNEPVRAEKSAVPEGFFDSPSYWLILYFFFNLGLTLFNKVVLVSFPFPYVSGVLQDIRSNS